MRLNRVLRYRPRYADVAATLALLLATSGTAYAAGAFPAHSVGAKQLKRSAVTKSKVATGAIISSKLRPSSVTATKLATGSVTASKLATGSVTSSKIADGSVTLADIVGTDVTGNISISITANSCLSATLTVAGAVVGQVAYLSWVGSTPPPSSVVDGPMKVTGPDTVVARFCNISSVTVTATNIGVRVITLG